MKLLGTVLYALLVWIISFVDADGPPPSFDSGKIDYGNLVEQIQVTANLSKIDTIKWRRIFWLMNFKRFYFWSWLSFMCFLSQINMAKSKLIVAYFISNRRHHQNNNYLLWILCAEFIFFSSFFSIPFLVLEDANEGSKFCQYIFLHYFKNKKNK